MNTPTVGYPVHAVARYRQWTNPHGVQFTDWTAACGATGTQTGSRGVFGVVRTARRGELCPACWPGRNHRTYHPTPVNETSGKGRR